MTIDERLEALVQTVELLASLHKNDHERLTKTREDADKLLETAARQAERHGALAQTAELLLATARQDGENIRALERIAEIHERRLTALEGGK